jgi:hypothetical protein
VNGWPSGTGRLEIRYLADIRALLMSSYAFASDGSEFHPAPDLVTAPG